VFALVIRKGIDDIFSEVKSNQSEERLLSLVSTGDPNARDVP
jgi:hypothetical protein